MPNLAYVVATGSLIDDMPLQIYRPTDGDALVWSESLKTWVNAKPGVTGKHPNTERAERRARQLYYD